MLLIPVLVHLFSFVADNAVFKQTNEGIPGQIQRGTETGFTKPSDSERKKSTRPFCTSLLPKKGCSFGSIFLAFSSLPGRRAGLLQFPADFCHPMSSSQLPVLVSLPLQLFMLPLPDRVTKGFTHIFTYLYIYSFNSVHT